jgi:1-acyl-sn-glycerol-3-phosphate acyltransferase
MRYIKSIGIIALSAVSGFLVLAFSWLPNGGVYRWVSHKFWGPGLLWMAGVKLKVEGLENLNSSGASVFYANHQSHFDIPAITTAVPIPMYFIAKRELLKIPFFGWGMWAIGMVFVDRSNPDKAKESMQKAARAVKKGKHIITFPEGTRSKDGKLQAFKKGTFHLAKSGPIGLIPIAVKGTHDVLPPGGKLRSAMVTVRIGTPITEAEVAELSLPELTKMARERLDSML